MHRLLLSTLLVSALVGCTYAGGLDEHCRRRPRQHGRCCPGKHARAWHGQSIRRPRKDIIQLDLEQNDANSIGDSEGMIDRMLADDTLWIGATGRTVTKPQILAVTRYNFQKNPTRTKKDAAPHDDFGLRRFGDVIVQHGRSTTLNPDGSRGQARRYLIVLQKQRGQWWVIGRETIPIDYTPQPDSAEVLAVQAQAKPSPTSRIILGKEVEPEVEKEILRLSAAQNDAAATGDSENLSRDRLFADDIDLGELNGTRTDKGRVPGRCASQFSEEPQPKGDRHDQQARRLSR